MSSGSRSQTVGYWYRPSFHMPVCQGPVDALVRIRGADVDAWSGRVEANDTITIDRPQLWGGDRTEGGIQGDLDVMLGAGDQAVNTAVASQVGPDASAHRGVVAVLWKGGRFGAMNPYPKALSLLVERILAGWQDDDPWYPATAPVPLGVSVAVDAVEFQETFPTGSFELYNVVSGTGSFFSVVGGAMFGAAYTGSGTNEIIRRSIPAMSVRTVRARFRFTTTNLNDSIYMQLANSGVSQMIFIPMRHDESDALRRPFINLGGDTSLIGSAALTPGEWYRVELSIGDGAGQTTCRIYNDTSNALVAEHTFAAAKTPFAANQLDFILDGDTDTTGPGFFDDILLRSAAGSAELVGMNPAHIIYDALTHELMQGEPTALVNAASFTAAADTLFAEGFGLCPTYNPQSDSIEQFIQRICAAIAGSCTRDPTTGEWFLDLVRGDYVLASLPVLTDDDILEYEEEPWVIDDAVNEVSVKYMDPGLKQERTTVPLQALGAIEAVGRVNAQKLEHRCIPTETLAQRVAARELRSRASPLLRLKLKTTRKPYAWRVGTYFRLQAPARGIADMVCLVGEIDRGTLRSGAISITALQDVFGMPETVYVSGQPPIAPPSTTPLPIVDQLAFEAPYVELVQNLGAGDLAALADDAGYLAVVAARPGAGVNYELNTRVATAEYAAIGNFDWCPTALVVEAAGRPDTAFTLSGASLLDRVEVGTAALWGAEIVRVDAIDADAGTLTLARGCADTVPQAHDAGERIWFYDAWASADSLEYVDGETVDAKLLTRTGTAILDLIEAPVASATFDSRAARPYPPGLVRINGLAAPATVETPGIDVTWAHRDRELQADQLVDTEAASVGPELGTTYSARLLRTDTEAVLDSVTGVSGTTTTLSTAYVGEVRVELWSERDGFESWQRHAIDFLYLADGRVTEDDEVRVTEGDEIREQE
jgi:hypothetical protein